MVEIVHRHLNGNFEVILVFTVIIGSELILESGSERLEMIVKMIMSTFYRLHDGRKGEIFRI